MKHADAAPTTENIVNIIIGMGASISATIGENIVAIRATSLAKPKEVCENMGGKSMAKPKYEMFRMYAMPTLASNNITGVASGSESLSSARGIDPSIEKTKPAIRLRLRPSLWYNL